MEGRAQRITVSTLSVALQSSPPSTVVKLMNLVSPAHDDLWCPIVAIQEQFSVIMGRPLSCHVTTSLNFTVKRIELGRLVERYYGVDRVIVLMVTGSTFPEHWGTFTTNPEQICLARSRKS